MYFGVLFIHISRTCVLGFERLIFIILKGFGLTHPFGNYTRTCGCTSDSVHKCDWTRSIFSLQVSNFNINFSKF